MRLGQAETYVPEAPVEAVCTCAMLLYLGRTDCTVGRARHWLLVCPVVCTPIELGETWAVPLAAIGTVSMALLQTERLRNDQEIRPPNCPPTFALMVLIFRRRVDAKSLI